MTQRRGSARVCGALIAVVLVLSAGAGTAGASEVAEAVSGDQPVLTSRTLPVAHQADRQAMWIWNKGGVAFQVAGMAPADAGVTELAAWSLDTGAEAGRLRFPAGQLMYQAAKEFFAYGSPSHLAVDEDGGRLFAPYRGETNVGLAGNGVVVRSDCVAHPSREPACLGGVHVVDAATMKIQKSMPLRLANPESGAVSLTLRAVSYAAPRAPGDAAKVLVVAEEIANWRDAQGAEVEPRWNGLNIVHVIQFDVESGQQDWIVRLDGCRGSRDKNSSDFNGARTAMRPNPAAVFRAGSLTDPAVWVACNASGRMGMIARIPLDANGFAQSLPVAIGDPDATGARLGDPAAPAPAPGDVVTVPPALQYYPGPTPMVEVLADAAGERFALRVYSGNTPTDGEEVWWVFDGKARAFIGTVGIGKAGFNTGASVLDPASGRLYILHEEAAAHIQQGLYMVDLRRTPLPQAVVYPQFASLVEGNYPPAVRSATGNRPPELYVRKDPAGPYRIIEDHVPPSVEEALDTSFEGRTLDLEEVAGQTSATFDGAARGYGARTIIMGGAEGLTRVGPADPLGATYEQGRAILKGQRGEVGAVAALIPDAVIPPDPCSNADRDLVVSFVGPDGPAVVDGTGSRGGAEPIVVDDATRADMEAAGSRCSRTDWASIWSGALFGQPLVDEPTVPWLFGDGSAECVSGSERSSDSVGDAVASNFAARVECEDEEASGFSYVRSLQLGELGLSEALSSFRIYRDPGRGVVSRVESVTRGIGLPGVLRIDSVRATGESWANGRKQPVAAADREAGYNPNCDFERSAGSCYQRHAFGVWTPKYSCGPCGDELRVIEAMNRALGANGRAAFRSPDPELAKGSENGFLAAVQKPDDQRFGDLVLNNDLLQTVVPTLEIVRLTASSSIGTGRRGQQLYQFAGVEVSSSYAISCLLVYDEATNTCAGEKQTPGAIQVSLSDPDGKALAGGAFEVRQDVDADGVLGLKDTLLSDGACVTTDDGVGTCTFEALQPGAYLVNQVAAPPGYAKSAEPFVVELASGEQRTVAFTNVSNLSTVELKATDENGAPVSGAVFAAYPDPDSDGKVAPDAKPAAECTTGADGACSMQVPAGSYVLVQTSAPAGLEGIEPVAFTFASGGQVAAVTVVNYPPETPGTVEPEASPVIDYSPPVDAMPPTEMVDESYVAPEVAEVPETVDAPVLAQVGDTVTQVIRAPGDALRLLARDPKEAVAWTAALALFCLAVMAIRRRQQAIALIQQ